MLGKVKAMLRVSEAGVIVKQALRALPLPPVDPDALATRLVAISYNSKPQLFDGNLGKPPQPVTTAAVSLAGGLTLDEYDAETKQCIFLALGSVLLDVSANGRRYGLSPNDIRLLQLSQAAYLQHDKAQPPRFVAQLSQTAPRQPDMTFAAKSYARIALMRMNDPSADFHATEVAYIEMLRKNGANELQALSASWGGVYGNDVDLQEFKERVKDFDLAFAETAQEAGLKAAALSEPMSRFQMAATLHLTLVMGDKPGEFERFLSFMKR